jgi:tetratricopeptide (TPR) repeat protein
MRQIALFLALVVPVVTVALPKLAEREVLILSIAGADDRPIDNVQITVKGAAGPGISDNAGNARIRLAPGTSVGTWVQLLIVQTRSDLAILVPWNDQAQVPPYDNETQNYVPVILVGRGERDLLRKKRVRRALTERINAKITPEMLNSRGAAASAPARAEVAARFGVSAATLDDAIRQFASESQIYDQGLAALYDRRFAQATPKLAEALREREAATPKLDASVAEAAFFLGQSLYAERRYQDAKAAFEKSVRAQPNNGAAYNYLAFIRMNRGEQLNFLGDDSAASLLRLALAAYERQGLGDSSEAAPILNSIAVTAWARQDYPRAETFLRRVVAIEARASSVRPEDFASHLENLAEVQELQANLNGADSALRQAVVVRDRDPGPPDLAQAQALTRLGRVLAKKENPVAADSFFSRALEIQGRILGRDNEITRATRADVARVREAAARKADETAASHP